MDVFLTTDRLVLRAFRPGDFGDIHACPLEYESVYRMTLGSNTPEQTQDYLERQCPASRMG